LVWYGERSPKQKRVRVIRFEENVKDLPDGIVTVVYANQTANEIDEGTDNLSGEYYPADEIRISFIELVHWIKTQTDKKILIHSSDYIVDEFLKSPH